MSAITGWRLVRGGLRRRGRFFLPRLAKANLLNIAIAMRLRLLAGGASVERREQARAPVATVGTPP
jgi:hypothetical protein